MDAFPDAHTQVGTNVEIVSTVAVGVGDGPWNQFFDGLILRIASLVEEFGQLVKIFCFADVGLAISSFSPMDVSVSQSNGCGLVVDIFLKSNDTPIGYTEAKAIAVFVGKVNHDGDFGIVEVQFVTTRIKPEMRVDRIPFVGTFLVEKHFKSDIHPVGYGYQGSGTGMYTSLAETVALVAVDLGDVAAKKHLALDNLGMD